MTLLKRLLRRDRSEAAELYAAIVARGRQPHWYAAGAVPDTIDGRFDMIAAILSLVLLRLETQPESAALNTALAERFVDDMDPQLRQIGIGDLVVGKHVGRMMSMLGGRLGAFRDGLAAGDIDTALRRNLYRGEAPADAALAHVRDSLLAFHAGLAATPMDVLAKGDLPE
ncbi:ubiquinol-cytochrome C chaperone family protein [Stakelama tenebrarum]|uniref:Ubiquinol-cytochrome C chaperone n=1 Tax=Stakelama tenebrarum TaxID=2711215 RepID=A0A6G6Y1I9_9SPHN|nr:ubiquinol-cytochrome C chaperone family protein [Sphingosinithalassobacter tenebrarum]QIG78804.1 ubiquinol-cytochrome C chaperone [Sphingosinithalassobacter tenebrarum]